jgi:hypothetical protein
LFDFFRGTIVRSGFKKKTFITNFMNDLELQN